MKKKKIVMVITIIGIAFFAMIAVIAVFCHVNDINEDDCASNSSVVDNLDFQQEAEELVFEYAVVRGETIEYKMFDFSPLYGDSNPMEKYKTLLSDEVFEEQKQFIQERWNAAIYECVYPGDVQTIKKSENEYLVELCDKSEVLYPGTEIAVEELRTWRYKVYVDEDEKYISEIEPVNYISNNDVNSERSHSSFSELIGVRVGFYIIQRIEATSDCANYGFEALLPYLSSEGTVVEDEGKYVADQLAQNLLRNYVDCEIGEAEKIDDNGNYRVSVKEEQRILINEDTVSLETRYWIVDVNASIKGILITNIIPDPNNPSTSEQQSTEML